MKTKPNEKHYYIWWDLKFVETSGSPVVIKGYENFDFFIAEVDGKYHIYEGKTGKCVGHGFDRADAIAQFHYYMEQNKWTPTILRRNINSAVKRTGLSPRWKKDNGKR